MGHIHAKEMAEYAKDAIVTAAAEIGKAMS